MSMTSKAQNAGQEKGGKLNGRWVPLCQTCIEYRYKTPGYCCVRAAQGEK